MSEPHTGWECPRCHTVHAPFIGYCTCRHPKEPTQGQPRRDNDSLQTAPAPVSPAEKAFIEDAAKQWSPEQYRCRTCGLLTGGGGHICPGLQFKRPLDPRDG